MKNMRKITRRDAINYSCMTVAGLSLAGLEPKKLVAQGQPQAQEPWPDTLVERPLRNIAPLPLNPDGSAPEHSPNEAGPLSEPTLWRYNKNEPPQVDYDYRRMRIKVDSRARPAHWYADVRRPGTAAAPQRLIIPFRYGARHVKAISEIIFTPTGFPLPTLPG